MKSIAEIFDNSNQMIDSIHNFFDRYIGNDLLRKCRISKIVDKIINKEYEYDQENNLLIYYEPVTITYYPNSKVLLEI